MHRMISKTRTIVICLIVVLLDATVPTRATSSDDASVSLRNTTSYGGRPHANPPETLDATEKAGHVKHQDVSVGTFTHKPIEHTYFRRSHHLEKRFKLADLQMVLLIPAAVLRIAYYIALGILCGILAVGLYIYEAVAGLVLLIGVGLKKSWKVLRKSLRKIKRNAGESSTRRPSQSVQGSHAGSSVQGHGADHLHAGGDTVIHQGDSDIHGIRDGGRPGGPSSAGKPLSSW
ncbi:hypothetical protein SeMB42_g07645 [Synchytrium endobioticum]|uniref:Copper transporter n=1 Tax=Synchytrium endobioticum TaxID=286115 RepID=A0A507BQZ8_9FUNG|nr:hypothetical protein SeMB42_g07645 [Synchytrium endobioticum]